jgi:transcriptional regulator with XRE-family HTH domain
MKRKAVGTLGHRLEIARVQAGYSTITSAARDLGITRQALSRWERDERSGEMNMRSLRKVAATYGVSADWLLEITPASESVCNIADVF